MWPWDKPKIQNGSLFVCFLTIKICLLAPDIYVTVKPTCLHRFIFLPYISRKRFYCFSPLSIQLFQTKCAKFTCCATFRYCYQHFLYVRYICIGCFYLCKWDHPVFPSVYLVIVYHRMYLYWYLTRVIEKSAIYPPCTNQFKSSLLECHHITLKLPWVVLLRVDQWTILPGSFFQVS